MISEILMKAILLLVAIMYVVMASKDNSCDGCGDREIGYCWFIMLLTLLTVFVGCLTLIGMLFQSVFIPNSMKITNPKDPFVEEERKSLKTKDQILEDVITKSQISKQDLKANPNSVRTNTLTNTEN